MEIWGRRGKEHHRHGRSSWYKCHTNASFEAVFNNHESHVVLKYHCCNLIWSGSVSTLCVSKYLSFSPSLLYVFNPMDIFHHLFYHCHYSPSYLQLSWYQVPSSLQRSSFCISECTYHVGITFFFFFFHFAAEEVESQGDQHSSKAGFRTWTQVLLMWSPLNLTSSLMALMSEVPNTFISDLAVYKHPVK